MSRQLPERPNLEQLKNQAKSLLRAAHAGEEEALRRFAVLPAFAGAAPDAATSQELALHDAQSVLAREYGFPSWKALREEVETRGLSFEAAVDEFVRSATGGAEERAERLLARFPRIPSASLYSALVLGDAARVRAALDAEPGLATRRGGPQNWDPLLYVCHTCLHRRDPSRTEGLVAIARELCARGADPNAEYQWDWHPELPRTALWGAICSVAHLPLAEVLLAAGANPTDGVSAHIAGGGGNLAALELLERHGMNVDGIPGGVPPLVYMMTWASDPAGPNWLLERGADPNLAWGEDAEAPLHVAARRWDVAMVDRLLEHGADPRKPRGDGRRPYALAALHGNTDVAAHLASLVAGEELSPLDRFVAACARGDRAAADRMLAANPELRAALRPADHLMLHHPAEEGDVRALETMLENGFRADARDKDNVTPLHRAAMSGHPRAVRTLLAHGADVNALDGMFAATPLVWAVEGWGHARPDADHVGVARVLIEAGSSLEWQAPERAPDQERTHEGLARIRRASAQA